MERKGWEDGGSAFALRGSLSLWPPHRRMLRAFGQERARRSVWGESLEAGAKLPGLQQRSWQNWATCTSARLCLEVARPSVLAGPGSAPGWLGLKCCSFSPWPSEGWEDSSGELVYEGLAPGAGGWWDRFPRRPSAWTGRLLTIRCLEGSESVEGEQIFSPYQSNRLCEEPGV